MTRPSIVGILVGFFVGISFPTIILLKFFITNDIPFSEDKNVIISSQEQPKFACAPTSIQNGSSSIDPKKGISKIFVSSNPRGTEHLPPGILVSESDFYLRRLWGVPNADLPIKPKYLVTFTVGYDQKANIDAAVKKFSENFTILLFHYDGHTSEWDEFEWSKRAIHVSARRQTKWWYAKRFLHPDIVAPYEYIFIWDEDLDLEHFSGEEYIKIVKKHGLEISQPALENEELSWEMTRKRNESQIHKRSIERPGRCSRFGFPPCAAFVEIMAPVFSRNAWRCVWHMIQNDLVHGWGLDFVFWMCVESAKEKMGVVDAQSVLHLAIPSLGNQGQAQRGRSRLAAVRDRSNREWKIFQYRMAKAVRAYYKKVGLL